MADSMFAWAVYGPIGLSVFTLIQFISPISLHDKYGRGKWQDRRFSVGDKFANDFSSIG